MIKQKKNAGINRNRKEKTTQEKLTILEEIYQKVLAKERRLKRYRQKVKQYRQNRTFQNNERKFYQQLEGYDNKTYQQPDAKENQRFWTKIWQPKKHNEKAEWINHITRELEELEEGPVAEIHYDLLKTTLKMESNWKTSSHDGIHGFWFKKFTSIHDRQALEMNKCLQRAHVPKDDQRKDYIDTKGPKQRIRPKQLQTHSLPTNDVANINSTNKGRNLPLANKPRIVP